MYADEKRWKVKKYVTTPLTSLLSNDGSHEPNKTMQIIQTSADVGSAMVLHCCITSAASSCSSCRSPVYGLETIDTIAAMNNAALVRIHPSTNRSSVCRLGKAVTYKLTVKLRIQARSQKPGLYYKPRGPGNLGHLFNTSRVSTW